MGTKGCAGAAAIVRKDGVGIDETCFLKAIVLLQCIIKNKSVQQSREEFL